MTITTTMQRELYSELGTLAAAYRIEARRHLAHPIRAALEDGADIVADIRARYWAGRMTDRAALGVMAQAEAILEAVVEWDA